MHSYREASGSDSNTRTSICAVKVAANTRLTHFWTPWDVVIGILSTGNPTRFTFSDCDPSCAASNISYVCKKWFYLTRGLSRWSFGSICHWTYSSRRFERSWCFHFRVQAVQERVFFTLWVLNMKMCFETSVRTYPVANGHVPKDFSRPVLTSFIRCCWSKKFRETLHSFHSLPYLSVLCALILEAMGSSETSV
jgi:hypothetical protein